MPQHHTHLRLTVTPLPNLVRTALLMAWLFFAYSCSLAFPSCSPCPIRSLAHPPFQLQSFSCPASFPHSCSVLSCPSPLLPRAPRSLSPSPICASSHHHPLLSLMLSDVQDPAGGGLMAGSGSNWSSIWRH